MVNYHNLEDIKNSLTLPKKYILSFALMLLDKNRIFQLIRAFYGSLMLTERWNDFLRTCATACIVDLYKLNNILLFLS